MGNGIAEVCAQVGQVILVDIDQARARGGLEAIGKRLSRQVEKGRMDEATKETILARIHPTGELKELGSADLVVEAALEDLEVKKELFLALGEICSPECILGTNTSALSITEVAAHVPRPERVVGIHFFNPATVMKLVEVVRTPFTSQASVDKAVDIVTSLGKSPVLVEESPGFVVNRILVPMINEAIFILGEGVASAEDIDTAMRLGANHPMGPLALADLIGLDICLAIMETLHRELGEDKYRPAPLLRKMVRAGRLGRKTKHGFFTYN